MQHPVVRPAEPEHLELVIGIADEVPIGKEQQFDDIPAQIARLQGRRLGLGAPRIGSWWEGREIYVSHIDVSWVQCYKTISRDEILSRFVRGDVASGLRTPEEAKKAWNLSTVRLSCGISANILDFRIPQKHVLADMMALKPAAGLVGGVQA